MFSKRTATLAVAAAFGAATLGYLGAEVYPISRAQAAAPPQPPGNRPARSPISPGWSRLRAPRSSTSASSRSAARPRRASNRSGRTTR